MVHIATIHSAHAYTEPQIREMCAVWAGLNRGLLCVYEPPELDCASEGIDCERCDYDRENA